LTASFHLRADKSHPHLPSIIPPQETLSGFPMLRANRRKSGPLWLLSPCRRISSLTHTQSAELSILAAQVKLSASSTPLVNSGVVRLQMTQRHENLTLGNKPVPHSFIPLTIFAEPTDLWHFCGLLITLHQNPVT